MTIIIHISARAPTDDNFPVWFNISFRNVSMAGLSMELLSWLLSPLNIRSKKGASIPKEAIPKTMERIMQRK